MAYFKKFLELRKVKDRASGPVGKRKTKNFFGFFSKNGSHR